MTDPAANLTTATVVIVGVGEHEAGAGWSLAGPVPDALRFAQYFLDRGVPAERVQVLSTPLPPDGALPEGALPPGRPGHGAAGVPAGASRR
ncbi:hypothetical protein [Dactylosporangium cerinum]